MPVTLFQYPILNKYDDPPNIKRRTMITIVFKLSDVATLDAWLEGI